MFFKLLPVFCLLLRLNRILQYRFFNRKSAESTINAARTQFYLSVWQASAQTAGADFTDIGHGFFEIAYKQKVIRILNNYTPLDDIISMRIAANKKLTASLLEQSGLKVPRNAAFRLNNIDKAYEFLKTSRKPCVIKPLKGTAAGKGICTGIINRKDLTKAAIQATLLSKDLLIEEQISGNNYRLFFLEGAFLDAVLRTPPKIVGDGKSTIKQLIKRENQLRLRHGWTRAQSLINIDYDLTSCLKKQDFSLSSVLPTKKEISIKSVVNDNSSFDNHRVTHLLCPSIIDDCRRAAQLIGAKVAGVDIITPDPALPLLEGRGAILEVNTTPGFYYHYQNIDGPFNLASHILNRLLN